MYPREFCRAVCEGIAAQKRLYSLGMVAQPLMSIEEMISAVPEGATTADPSGELHETDQTMEAYDDQTGAELQPSKVAVARREEIEYFKTMGVYEKVSIDECWITTGRPPVAVRWVDINKGDEANPNYRSRFVAKEFLATSEDMLDRCRDAVVDSMLRGVGPADAAAGDP